MKLPKPTKEQQVLFSILKGNPPSDLEGVDTGRLFELFRRHRLFPLAQGLLGLLAPDEQLRWEKAIITGSLRSLRFIPQLLELIEILGKKGIEVIPLKGPLLANILYGDTGQRHIRDLDLLVIKGDLLMGVEVLKEAGFEHFVPGRNLRQNQWRYYFRHHYDVSLVGKEPRIVVELHSGIAYPGLLYSADKSLTDDLQLVEIAGVHMSSMSRESTFLYLALHGAHHLYFRLFWLRDLAEALRLWELDHKALFNKANKLGIERMVGVSLRLAESYFGVPAPKAWQRYLEDHDSLLNRLENRCHRIILHPYFLSRRSRLNALLFTLAMKPGWRHKWDSISSVFHRWYIRKYLSR